MRCLITKTLSVGVPILSTVLLAVAFIVVPMGWTAKADGSAVWDKQDVLDWNELIMDITAVDHETAWFVGTRLEDAGFGAGSVLRTSNAGDSWEYRDTGTERPLLGISAANLDTVWAVGDGTIIRSRNGGINWTEQGLGGAYFLTGVSAVDENNAWAVGRLTEGGPPPGYYDVVLRTTDGGSEWAVVYKQEGAGGYKDIAAIDADTAYVSTAGGLLRTSNGGMSWETISLSADVNLTRVSCLDGENIWALGYVTDIYGPLVVFNTADGGTEWRRHDFDFIPSNTMLAGLEIVDADIAWVVAGLPGVDAQSGAGFIWETVDGGGSWSRVEPGFGIRGLCCCAAMGNTTLFGGMGFILRSIAGGSSGLTVTSATPDTGSQFAWAVGLQVAGTGFQPGAAVRLERGAAVLNAYGVSVVSGNQVTCTVGTFGAEPGAYDVVVVNPDGREARLPGAFTVTSPCGAGSGGALLMLGLTLGLLSLAGTAGWRRKATKAGG